MSAFGKLAFACFAIWCRKFARLRQTAQQSLESVDHACMPTY